MSSWQAPLDGPTRRRDGVAPTGDAATSSALRPAEQQVVLNRLAGVYPDDEIARRLNVSTRTVLRHRSRNSYPRTPVTSGDPTRHRPNQDQRQFQDRVQEAGSRPR